MLKVLGSFEKQSADINKYPIDFSRWFKDEGVASFVVSTVEGIATVGQQIGKVIETTVSGGSLGVCYKISVIATSDSGLVKQADFLVTIVESSNVTLNCQC